MRYQLKACDEVFDHHIFTIKVRYPAVTPQNTICNVIN